MAKPVLFRFLTFLASLLQVASAIAIICIVALHLTNVNVNGSAWQELKSIGNLDVLQNQCLLSGSWEAAGHSYSLCTYTYIVAGASLFATAVLSIVQCITCHLCGLGGILDFIFAGFGFAWWIVASIILTNNGVNDKDNGLPQQDWRTAVFVLSWAEVGLFGLVLLMGVLSTLVSFYDCCSESAFRSRDIESGAKPVKPRHVYGAQHQFQTTPAPVASAPPVNGYPYQPQQQQFHARGN